MGSLLILSLIFLLNNFISAANANPYFQYNSVSNEKFMANSAYGATLNLLLTKLSEDFKYGFSKISVGQSPDQVNAVGLCRGDQMEDSCRMCLTRTMSELQQLCSEHKEAIGWSDFCMVRYSTHEIFGVVETYPFDVQYNGNASDIDGFNLVLSSLLNDLTNRAAAGGAFCKFAAGNIKGTDSCPIIYALEQCTPDLSQEQCMFCLATAIGRIATCCYAKTGCRIVQPSCSVRYETNPFFVAANVTPYQSSPAPGEGKGKFSSVYSVAGILLFVICIFLCIFLIPKKPKPSSLVMVTSEMKFQFSYHEIRIAANYFSEENKLGQGGFGAVYKGMLLDGREIAIKVLLNSRQRDTEFNNEVHLMAQLQHRNLVRLFGFCSERNERLLIYEFVANRSLDYFLFDRTNREQLDWKKRREIIKGVASGLHYLHKYSHIRTIHCDLKTSNILLDKSMKPKIADFGCARVFEGDESQGNASKAVGTYGYMALEYAMHGHISLKTDVFSFGVLMLEIVSGQRANNYCSNGKSILLSTAWENWRNKTATELIDPPLRDGLRSQIIRCIHIALLCIQDYEVRPNMDSVVNKLNCNKSTLQEPKAPAFLVNQECGALRECFENLIAYDHEES